MPASSKRARFAAWHSPDSRQFVVLHPGDVSAWSLKPSFEALLHVAGIDLARQPECCGPDAAYRLAGPGERPSRHVLEAARRSGALYGLVGSRLAPILDRAGYEAWRTARGSLPPRPPLVRLSELWSDSAGRLPLGPLGAGVLLGALAESLATLAARGLAPLRLDLKDVLFDVGSGRLALEAPLAPLEAAPPRGELFHAFAGLLLALARPPISPPPLSPPPLSPPPLSPPPGSTQTQ
jgi:hypothetical protein